ncbi:MAG: hypothetical protein GY853_01385 [PVC group bacterium]|nr:hypothetical protein [PVC group bacterium]
MIALEKDGEIVKKGSWYAFADAKKTPEPEVVEVKNEDDLDEGLDVIGSVEIKETAPKVIKKIQPIPVKNVELAIKKEEKKVVLKPKKPKKSKKKPKPKPRAKQEDMGLAMYVIRTVMLVVGIGSIAISIFYNIKLSKHFLPEPFSTISGIIFVLFAVISFETIIYFLSFRRMAMWAKTIAVSGFIFLWLVVTLFTISATLSGRYERFMLNEKLQTGSNREVNAGKLKWKSIQNRKEDVKKRIGEKRRQLNQLYKISEGVENLEDREEHGNLFKDTQWRISLVEKHLNRLSNKLEGVRGEEIRQLEENPEMTSADESSGSNDDFYKWLGGIFNASKEQVHFYISLLPAFFFDIVSSISISVFLFLRRE